MPAPNVSAVVQMSTDAHTVSNALATWQDVTDRFIEYSTGDGIRQDLDEVQPGSGSFTFDNSDRYLELGYQLSPYAGLIGQGVRFRILLNDAASGLSKPKGVWYATEWGDPTYQTMYGEITIEVGCGLTVVEEDRLPALDPPDAQSYDDVVNFDEPWGYWRLGEPEGTKAVAHVKKVWKGKGKRRRKVKRKWTTIETAAEAGGVSGPAGVYQNTPQLGQPGLLVGDRDTSVLFTAAQTEWAQAAVDAETFVNVNALSVEAWVKFTAIPAGGATIVSGPRNTAGANRIFELAVSSSGDVSFVVLGAGSSANAGAGSVTTGSAHHLCGTWDGTTISVYVNGVLMDSEAAPGTMSAANTNLFVYIGREEISSGDPDYMDGWIDEVAVYEKGLPADRVLAHWQAGAERGYPEQTVGERIEQILDDSLLWDTSSIVASAHTITPAVMAGQSRLDEIRAAAECEVPQGLVFMDDEGDPRYLAWDFGGSEPYGTPQAEFGDLYDWEVPYDGLEVVADEEFVNEVLVTHEMGPSATATNTAGKGRRVNDDLAGLALVYHPDVEAVAQATLETLGEELGQRVVSMTLSGVHEASRVQILTREIGDLIRIKRRGPGLIPIDIVTRIIGKEIVLDRNLQLAGTFHLARGFDASELVWHLGITGYSELDASTVLA